MKIISILFVFSLLFFGCKKYPEDETFIHFKRPKNRMEYKSTWQITEYKINGADSIPHVETTLPFNGRLTEIDFVNAYDALSTYWDSKISFEFLADKTKVKMNFRQAYPITYPLLADGPNDWDIIRLDRTVFIAQLSKNGKNYRIAFKRIRTQ